MRIVIVGLALALTGCVLVNDYSIFRRDGGTSDGGACVGHADCRAQGSRWCEGGRCVTACVDDSTCVGAPEGPSCIGGLCQMCANACPPGSACAPDGSCVVCDADLDGYLANNEGCNTAGMPIDCNDADPFTFPGATEVCGDGVANDCVSPTPDAICSGLGTFVSFSTGLATNPGTRDRPVATIAQGMTNAMAIGNGVDVFVAAGVYLEGVTMVDGIALYGGFDAASWDRDPMAQQTLVQGSGIASVTFPSGVGAQTILDGFTIQAPATSIELSAVRVEPGASPVVSNNVIVGGTAEQFSYGIYVLGGAGFSTGTPRIERNDVRLGITRLGGAYEGNTIGIAIEATPALVVNNRIALSSDVTVGNHQRGLRFRGCPEGAIARGNVVTGGVSAAAIAIHVIDGSVELDGNVAHPGVCQLFCHGLELGGAVARIRVTNNVFLGGTKQGASDVAAGCTLHVQSVFTSDPDVLLHSNWFQGGDGLGRTAGLRWYATSSTAVPLGRIFNNVVHGGAGEDRIALATTGTVAVYPATVASNAVFVDPAGATVSALFYLDELTGTRAATLAELEALPWAEGNIASACMAINPTVGGDFHLTATSECIDRGSSAELPATDFDGQARPMGAAPDIGPDEAR